MIDVKELRIGNKLLFARNEITNEIVTVAWVSNDSIGYLEQHEARYWRNTGSLQLNLKMKAFLVGIRDALKIATISPYGILAQTMEP